MSFDHLAIDTSTPVRIARAEGQPRRRPDQARAEEGNAHYRRGDGRLRAGDRADGHGIWAAFINGQPPPPPAAPTKSETRTTSSKTEEKGDGGVRGTSEKPARGSGQERLKGEKPRRSRQPKRPKPKKAASPSGEVGRRTGAGPRRRNRRRSRQKGQRQKREETGGSESGRPGLKRKSNRNRSQWGLPRFTAERTVLPPFRYPVGQEIGTSRRIQRHSRKTTDESLLW